MENTLDVTVDVSDSRDIVLVRIVHNRALTNLEIGTMLEIISENFKSEVIYEATPKTRLAEITIDGLQSNHKPDQHVPGSTPNSGPPGLIRSSPAGPPSHNGYGETIEDGNKKR